MIRVSAFSAHHRNKSATYHLTIDEWVWWKYWRSKLYHYYDIRFPVRVPGFKRLIEALGGETMKGNPFVGDGDEGHFVRLRAWVVEQDLRCYELSNQRETLASIEVSEEVYNVVTTKKC